MKRKANGVFVLIDPPEPTEVPGYNTLYVTALAQGEVPVNVRKLLPRYPLVSATLIGRLTIAENQQG